MNRPYKIHHWRDMNSIRGPYDDVPDNVYTILYNGRTVDSFKKSDLGNPLPLEFRNDLDTAECVVHLLNEKENFIQDLLYQIGYNGLNNKPCKGCLSFAQENSYCTMYDMETDANTVCVGCEYGEWKNDQ